MDSNSNNSERGARPGRVLRSNRAPRVVAALVLALAAVALLPRAASTQSDVRIGVQASGINKSPLLLGNFRAIGSVGSTANQAHDVAKGDFELSGLFAVREVPALDTKLTPDNSIANAVRIEGTVEMDGSLLKLTGEAFDLSTAESVFRRAYTFDRDATRATVHRFVDDVIEALTGERGICETQVAFVRTSGRIKEIWLMDYDGENQRQLTHDRSLALSPAWAPWGSEIAFTTFKRGNPDIYLFDLRRGASYPFSTRSGLNTAPNYSPDGKWIACTLSRDGNAEVYLISRDAQTAKRLTRNPRIDSSPCFSPTGRDIVFTSDRSGSPQLYVMDTEGLNQRLLTFEGKYNDSPQWSPKGDKIAYAARHDGIFDVVVIESNGQTPIQITSDSGHNENPRWSADARKIYFSSSRSGKRQIYMMNLDGSDVVQLTRGEESYNPATGPRPRKKG